MIFEKEILKKFSHHSIIVGILFIIAGSVGIFVPPVMSLSAAVFFGILLISVSIFTVHATFKSYKKSMGSWLKALILFITGLLTLIFPVSGVATLGILFTVYLFMDGFANLSFAFDMSRSKINSAFAIVNSIISTILAIWMLMGWPFSSIFWVGLIIGISLLFDGMELLAFGIIARRFKNTDI